MDKSREEKLKKIFYALDENHDGYLDKTELLNGYTSIFEDSTKAELELDLIFEKVDLNKNGKIDYTGLSLFVIHF